jgi:hypothetical protein
MSKGFEFADHLMGMLFDNNHHCDHCEENNDR